MQIRIPVSERELIRNALEFLGHFSPYKYLRTREIQVLSELYYHNHINKNIIDFDKRMEVVFGSKTKCEIIKKIDMSKGFMNNNLKELRRNGLITGTKLVEKYIINPDNVKELNIQFKII